jgi:hypothetical protein
MCEAGRERHKRHIAQEAFLFAEFDMTPVCSSIR